jgi:hypothetical protein
MPTRENFKAARIRFREDGRGLRLAKGIQGRANVGKFVGENRGCEQRGVLRAGGADGEGGNGTPLGIWAIDSKESMPFSALDCTGTPSTGTEVLAAVMPGRCAAPPHPR